MKRVTSVIYFAAAVVVVIVLVQTVRWFGTSGQDSRAPAPNLGLDTALVNSSVKTIEFDYDEPSRVLTVQIEACPPYLFGKWVGGEKLQSMAREELKRQLTAFRTLHPELDVRQTSYDSILATNFFRSAEDGNRKTIVTVVHSVE